MRGLPPGPPTPIPAESAAVDDEDRGKRPGLVGDGCVQRQRPLARVTWAVLLVTFAAAEQKAAEADEGPSHFGQNRGGCGTDGMFPNCQLPIGRPGNKYHDTPLRFGWTNGIVRLSFNLNAVVQTF